MATKLKNIKYSTGVKVTAVVLAWLCFVVSFGSALFLLQNSEIIRSNNYFDTNSFRMEYARLIHNTVELNVELKSEENIKASAEEKMIILDNLNRLQRIQDRLSATVNFAYYLKNTQTGEEITNVTEGTATEAAALIQKQATFAYYDQGKANTDYPQYANAIRRMLAGTPFEVYTAVIEPLTPGDGFYDEYIGYTKIKLMIDKVLAYKNLLIAAAFLMVLAIIYLVGVAGRREQGGEIVLSFVDKIYSDVHSVGVFFVILFSLANFPLNFYASSFYYYNLIESLVLSIIVLSLNALIGLNYVLSMTRQIKSGQIIKNTLIYRLFNIIRDLTKICFNGKTFKVWTLLLLLAYGLANGILFFSCGLVGEDEFFILVTILLIIPLNVAVVYFAAKALLSLTQIMGAAKEISMGNLDYPLDNTKISVAFSGFAEDIQSIQAGLKKAVAEAIKGERMKTDLITNVSHDLKTPLTSIINYVDLLKMEELNSEPAAEYVGILEEKSERLKQLIDDLIEASKASSGNLAVTAEKVDLQELVFQACGEYEEKIKQAQLDIRVQPTEKDILVWADGKQMWRIIENLLSNVVKYSMPNTRVYIDIVKIDQYGLLTIKNISAVPLEVSPDQLTERFVRGDVSRTTEGSGLGLAIAQSLTKLQGGQFKVEIDGDLFKVMIEIPLYNSINHSL
ncbi:MAG: sensor histidine kinase [Bacillota bacterium]